METYAGVLKSQPTETVSNETEKRMLLMLETLTINVHQLTNSMSKMEKILMLQMEILNKLTK